VLVVSVHQIGVYVVCKTMSAWLLRLHAFVVLHFEWCETVAWMIHMGWQASDTELCLAGCFNGVSCEVVILVMHVAVFLLLRCLPAT